MTWLVWRQHRNQAYFAAAALAAFAILITVTGLQMASTYRAALAACHGCGNLGNTLSLGSPPVIFLVLLTMAVPAVLGVFWGAPLVARELETGTSQFVWMQSITRGHWLTVKTGWILLASVAWGGAISALVTWWSSPLNALKHQNFKPGQFDIQGIVPVGYALFAVALGIAAGAVVRRTLPALALTLGIFATIRIAIAYFVRQHYLTAITATSSPGRPSGPAGSFWQLGGGLISPSGRVYQNSGLNSFLGGNRLRILDVCRLALRTARPRHVAQQIASCLTSRGYHGFITYQPASRYWTFQSIETGIFVLLAAAMITFAAIVLQRRDA